MTQAQTHLKHFRIISEIGKGGMGTVYLAQDVSLDRKVALKVLSPKLTRDEEMVERFVQEARAQARMNHPNIAHIYFVGAERGLHFFAMELVYGRTLAEIAEDKGALPWQEALEYTRQAALGLAEAHRQGVIHRDVKPSNLMLTDKNAIKIMDFGLARRIERDSLITGAGQILGTPAYMSPEQGHGQQTDLRSDIYSLGASLFHLIAGHPPFQADTPAATIIKHIREQPPRLVDVVSAAPKPVSDLVGRCLEKDPLKRFQSYEELIKAVDAALPRKITHAGLYTRFSAMLFDLVLLSAVGFTFLSGSLVQMVFYAAYFVLLESLFEWTPGKKVMKLTVRKSDGSRAFPARIGLRFIVAHWFLFAAGGIFYLLSKRVVDLKVFVQNEPLTALLLVLLLAFYILGLVSMAVTRGKRAFHDSLTRTIVMYDIR